MHVRTDKRTLHGASSAQALASRSSRVCFHASSLDLRPAPRPSEIVRRLAVNYEAKALLALQAEKFRSDGFFQIIEREG
jgi:hypothetical protein